MFKDFNSWGMTAKHLFQRVSCSYQVANVLELQY